MNGTRDIIRRRLGGQGIVGGRFEHPGEVVSWLGAVQAQDYRGALWAVGLRIRGGTESAVERALAERTMIRTWPMRGTLHFVAPADIRWMLALLASRALEKAAGRFRQLELDRATLARARRIAGRALRDGGRLTRDQLYRTLADGGVSPAGQRGIHVLGFLAQEGTICFGPPEGRQQTFVLLEEWVPPAPMPDRDEALAELARRYFTGHGPATLRDFVWWTGLTVADARTGLDLVAPLLQSAELDGERYWFAEPTAPPPAIGSAVHLLPAFDEYTVGYADRSAVLDQRTARRIGMFGLNPAVVAGGRVAAGWTRRLERGTARIVVRPVRPITAGERRALAAAARRYGAFLELPVEIARAAGAR